MSPAGYDVAASPLATIIDRRRPEIERRWLERVERDVAGASGIEPTHLRDGLPDYLAALVGLLSEDALDRATARSEPWTTVAREHGITRVQIGFDLTQLIHEFIILRHVIREVVEESGVPCQGPDGVLADVLDAAIATSASAYVEARDYAAKRRQAESIGFLTHELRNPLSTATLNLSQLRRSARPEHARFLDAMDRSLKRLASMIEGVLITERLEAGKMEARPVEIELGQILEPALEAARDVAERKGVDFRATFDPALRVRVDPLLTRSALQNLADNSVKFVDEGYVEVTVDDRADALVFHVRDTCNGITEEELRTIFEPFERGATGKAGSGLGLAIARRAVEAQGGSIAAESPGCAGCHFWITLPKRGA